MSTMLSAEQLSEYRSGALLREAARKQESRSRRLRAWRAAHRAASVLKGGFGANRVIVFGSLAHGAWFSPRSDIDLAVEGLAGEGFSRAWSAIELVASGFKVDLVDLAAAPERLRQRIREHGREL
jgi:predicted nucleotidyltransferase